MALLAQAHTTRAKVKLYLGITDASFDTLLEELINSITLFVEGKMGGRRIKKATYTNEPHDGGEIEVFLDNWPIIEPPAIVAEFRTGPVDTPTFKAFQANDFIVYPGGGFVHFFAKTPGGQPFGARPRLSAFDVGVGRGSRNLQFTYDAGFVTIPEDIELLANQLVGLQFNVRKSQGIRKEQVEGTSIEYDKTTGGTNRSFSLNEMQLATINRYMRHQVGQNF